jgi:hypothetical protein
VTDKPRWDRRAPVSGLLFVALSLAAWLLFIGAPGVDGSTSDAVDYLTGHRGRLLLAAALIGFAFLPFLWFLGTLFTRLQAAGEFELGAIAFGGGLVAGTLLLLTAAIPGALAFNIAETADEAAAKAIYDLVWPLQVLIPFPTAALVGAASIASLRAHLWPPAIGWAGIGCSIVVLVGGTTWARTGYWSPSHGYGYAALFVFLSWMAVTSVLIGRRSVAP